MMTKANKIDIARAQQVSIIDVLTKYGAYNEKTRTHISCPFDDHMDETASLKIYDNTNTFCCFGCVKGGGPVEFVKYKFKIDYEEAALKILDDFGIERGKGVSSKAAYIRDRLNKKRSEAKVSDYSDALYEFVSNLGEDYDKESIVKRISKLSLLRISSIDFKLVIAEILSEKC